MFKIQFSATDQRVKAPTIVSSGANWGLLALPLLEYSHNILKAPMNRVDPHGHGPQRQDRKTIAYRKSEIFGRIFCAQ